MALSSSHKRRGVVSAAALAAALLPLSKASPASAYTLLGPGCHFDVNQADIYMNLNTSGDSDGETAAASVDAALYWRQANTDAPDAWGYWPAPPYAGKGNLEIHTYSSATSPNSGYTSTYGPLPSTRLHVVHPSGPRARTSG
jgi:hypothetical protein